jgi:hypothetical protein
MPADPRLAALAALRKRAEEEAKALCEVCADTFALHMGADMPAMYERGWDGMHEDERDALTAANLALLCDPSRPASRRELAAMVAERIGWDAFDVTRAVESSTAMLAGLYRAAGLPELPRWEPAPTPAEALTLIAISTLTTTD